LKRAVVYAALALVLVTGASEGRQAVAERTRLDVIYAAAGHKANGPCSEDQWLRISPKEWSPELVRGLVRCAVARWSVAGGAQKAISVFSCESSLFPWADSNGNLGIGQLRFWADRVHRYLRARWFNAAQWSRIRTVPNGAFLARANVLVSVRLAHSGWGPWEAGKCA
jgi:hypothetical protein